MGELAGDVRVTYRVSLNGDDSLVPLLAGSLRLGERAGTQVRRILRTYFFLLEAARAPDAVHVASLASVMEESGGREVFGGEDFPSREGVIAVVKASLIGRKAIDAFVLYVSGLSHVEFLKLVEAAYQMDRYR